MALFHRNRSNAGAEAPAQEPEGASDPASEKVRFRGLWAGIYGCALAAFTAYILLDAFVFEDVQTEVQAANTTSIVASSGTTLASASTLDDTSSSDDSSQTSEVVSTDTYYNDGSMAISLTTTEVDGTTVYIADIQVTSAEYLKTALAQGLYGRNVKQTTSEMAEENDAVLAINGDYYGFRDDGYVIRNGVLYRDTASEDTDALVIYGDGTMASVNQSDVTAEQLLEDGAWQVLSFGPTLVEDGQIAVSESTEVDQAKASNPRTAIGMISPLHYVVVVSDGRTSESAGLSLYQLAQVFQDYGCTYAYNLDGGGSTTLWFNGQVVNNPTDGRTSGEREVSDIVYFG
jgi:exopolysaccharide biosynthesis protein